MSLSKIDCVCIECNNCGDIYEDSRGFSIFSLESDVHPEDDGWYLENSECQDIHYCPNCHEIDEQDNLIIKTKTESK